MTEEEKKYLVAGPYFLEFDPDGKVSRSIYSEKFRALIDNGNINEYIDGISDGVSYVHPDDIKRVAEEFNRVTRRWPNGPDFDIEYRMKTEKGYRWFHDYGEIQRTPEGMPTRLVGVVLDIDETVKSREEQKSALKLAEEANEAKNTFLFNMSHDLRTPLNAILGYAELLDKLIPEDTQPQAKYLHNINTAGKELLDIINEILEIVRIENHKILVEETPQSASALQEEVIAMFMQEAQQKNITLKTECYVTHDHLYVDKTHLQKIHMNLLGNAIKFTLSGGHVIMRLRELPGTTDNDCIIECIIEDDGIGMSKAFQKHLFEPFARELSATVSGIQGTGLGLPIVKKLVDLKGGTIRCESKRGIGTKMFVRLPHRIVQEAGGITHAVPYDDAIFKNRHILIAEDNDLNAEIAMEFLRSKGISSDWARNGRECVRMLDVSQRIYDLVLMDIQMPVMDGYEAARSIRRLRDTKRATIPIIAMTANAFREDIEKALASGMNDHIAKPIDTERMFAAIAKQLEK